MPAFFLSLPAEVERVARLSPGAREAACDEAVRVLRGPESLWPVDTGRSKRGWRRVGSGDLSRVFNAVPYASYVEGRWGHAGRRTLGLFAARIARAARRGRFRGGAPLAQRRDSSVRLLRRSVLAARESRRTLGVDAAFDAVSAAQRASGALRVPADLRLRERLARRVAAGDPRAARELAALLAAEAA